jgi:hypothetical protein
MGNTMKALLGLIIPIERSGKLLLKQNLKSYGVDVSKIPDECLQELTAESIKLGKNVAMMTKRDFSITHSVRFIEGSAVSIAQLLIDGVSEDALDSTIEILKRHGVISGYLVSNI